MAKVFISADHRGFAVRERLVEQWAGILTAVPQASAAPLLDPEDYELVDLGPAEYDPDDDFNDAAIAVARRVQKENTLAVAEQVRGENNIVGSGQARGESGAYGILICGSAHGIAMQANRFCGIRAICGYTGELARLGRQHNDANILCLSADLMDDATIDEVVRVFLATDFLAEERFIRRNRRLDEAEEGYAMNENDAEGGA